MPLPIVADTYLLRMNWVSTLAQRPAIIGLHFKDDAGGQTGANLVTDVNATVTAAMWELVSSTAGVVEISATKLDGATASVIFPIAAGPAKWQGQGGSDPILQGAVVVSVKSALRGPKHRNRCYLPFIGETGQQGGTLTPANLANMQAAWNTFLTAMLATGWAASVVSPTDQTQTPALAYVLRPFLKTQRRRSRR